MRFRAAWSPSWPDTGTTPSRPWAASAETTPPAVPSLEGDHGIDVVVVGGQELLHVALGIGRYPAIGIGLANVIDGAAVERALEHIQLAGVQEVGVRIGRRALDEHIVAGRLLFEHSPRLQAAHFTVVEGPGRRRPVFRSGGRNRPPECLHRRRPERPGRWRWNPAARMISASAPLAIRLSTSVSCLAAEDWASAEM